MLLKLLLEDPQLRIVHHVPWQYIAEFAEIRQNPEQNPIETKNSEVFVKGMELLVASRIFLEGRYMTFRNANTCWISPEDIELHSHA